MGSDDTRRSSQVGVGVSVGVGVRFLTSGSLRPDAAQPPDVTAEGGKGREGYDSLART